MAVPTGYHIQFRYRESLVSDDALKAIAAGQFSGQMALILFVDRVGELCAIPCRSALVVDARHVGSVVVLTLSPSSYAHTADPDELTRLLVEEAQATGAVYPIRTRIEEGDRGVAGSFCFRVRSYSQLAPTRANILTINSDVRTWEHTVAQLATRSGFEDVPTFIRIQDLSPAVDLRNGSASLKAGTRYELRVQHYHPGEQELQGGKLRLEASNSWVSFTDPTKVIDSPYDEKLIRFRTGNPSEAEGGIIAFFQTGRSAEVMPAKGTSSEIDDGSVAGPGEAGSDLPQNPENDEKWLVDLPYEVQPNRRLMLIQAALLGISLAAPHLVRAFTDDKLGLTITALVTSCVAAWIAVFNLRKSI